MSLIDDFFVAVILISSWFVCSMNGSKLMLDSVGRSSLSKSRPMDLDDCKDIKNGLKVIFPFKKTHFDFLQNIWWTTTLPVFELDAIGKEISLKEVIRFSYLKELVKLEFFCRSSSRISLEGTSRLVCSDIV